MARTPTTEPSRDDKKAKAENAEQEALLREVDDAVRQGDFESFMANYGKPLAAAIVLGLAGFAGYLFWDGQREEAMEASSEQLVTAFDQLEAGRSDTALGRLEAIEDEGSPALSAKMLRAGLAAESGDTDTAAALFADVIDAENAPDPIRNMALIRRTALTFDTMDPDDVVAAMQPLAVPGEPFFASAGELLGHAYIAQGKTAEAGALFGEIARHENTPETARGRMRNLAGIYGVDAVEDVDALLRAQQGAASSAGLIDQ